MTVRFAVRTQSPVVPNAWVRVAVHDTIGDLRRCAARVNPTEEHGDTAACFQPVAQRHVMRADGTWAAVTPRSYAGVLRITRDHGGAVLAHEVTHAALEVYRRHVDPDADLGPYCTDDAEETLAHLVGDLYGQIVRRLIDRGVWP